MRYIFLFVLFLSSVFALEFSGIGYGENEKEAKTEAMSDLSHNIKTEVITTFKSTKSEDNGKVSSNNKSDIQVSSNLPIVGAMFKIVQEAKSVKATVTLSPHRAKPFYIEKLKSLSQEIDKLYKKLKKSNELQSYSILTQLLHLLDEFDRYYSVAIALGVQNTSFLVITKSEVNSRILTINKTVASIEQAAKMVASEFRYKKVFIFPPKAELSDEVTPFAKAITSHLKGDMNIVKYPKEASYIIRGSYQVLKKGMILTYSLWDAKKNENLNSITLTLLPEIYLHIRTKPISISFEKLLREGVVYSDELSVSFTTNKGDESVLFNKGEEIELFIKLNHTGYFYIVGHTQTNEGDRSYLVELEDSVGTSSFIRFVSADDANHWMSLGRFTAEAPYGLETLQIVASDEVIRDFPHYHYDKKSGFNIIDEDIKKALNNTRSIMKSKKKKSQYSEAVLMFTTYE